MTQGEGKTHAQPAEPARTLKVTKILVPTDFSEASQRALGYAVALARRFDAYLFLLHVVTAVDDLGRIETSSPDYRAQRQQAELAIEKIMASGKLRDVPHEVLLEEGYLWPTVEQFILGREVDLVAMGTHGGPSAQRQHLGSAAELIFRSVDCPVLTVGPACRREAAPDDSRKESAPAPKQPLFERILFATDFGRAAEHATSYAVRLAEEFAAKLTLLHVLNSVPSNKMEEEVMRDTTRIRLTESVPEEAASRIRMEVKVEFGDGPEQILKVARAKNADLIVMGARPGLMLATHHLPETSAYTVAASAPCPLLTVRR